MRPLWRGMVADRPLGAAQSHASSLLVSGEAVLVAWFAGTHEGAADTRIHVARGGLDGVFATPVVVADAPVAHWNPVLASGPDGRVWLFFRRGSRIDTWTTWVCHSADAGRTWTQASELVPDDRSGGRGPVRQAPVAYADAWVAPGSVEVWSDPPVWDSFVDVCDDATAWRRVVLPLDHARVRGAGSIQPALVTGSQGQLVVLTRATGGATLRSETSDPLHWPALVPCGLPNNNSGLAAVGLPDGRLAAVHNTATQDWGSRGHLAVSTSADDGLSWRFRVSLEGEPANGKRSLDPGPDGSPVTAAVSGVVTSGEGEYSYPSASVVGDELWVTYTWQRRGIALARVPLDLLAGE